MHVQVGEGLCVLGCVGVYSLVLLLENLDLQRGTPGLVFTELSDSILCLLWSIVLNKCETLRGVIGVGLEFARLDGAVLLESFINLSLVDVLRNALDDNICCRISGVVTLSVQDNLVALHFNVVHCLEAPLEFALLREGHIAI